jgi:hypothetical protein
MVVSWEQALEFAATVPKPKKKEPEIETPHTPEKERNHHTLTDLQLMEAKHEADKQHIEVIHRSSLVFHLTVGKAISFMYVWTIGLGNLALKSCKNNGSL